MSMAHPAPHANDANAPLKWVSDLIERHCRYSSRSLDEVQSRLQSLRGSVSLSIERPQDFNSYRETTLTMGQLLLTVGCIDSSSGYDLSFKSGEEYIVTIPLRGSGWASTGGMFVEYGQGDVMIVSPLCRIDKHWDSPGEVLSIHIPAARFDMAIAEFDSTALRSGPMLRIESRQLRSFVRVVDMICSDLQDQCGASPFLMPRFSDQMERLLLALLLEGLRAEPKESKARVVMSPAIPYYVRRAEKFITSNGHLPIGLNEIATAAGVSTRTVQYGFRKYFDTTPMLYLKKIRYDRARAILLSDNSARKISEIALEIGCQNISQFSRDYRSLFGETPSNTLATPKGLVC